MLGNSINNSSGSLTLDPGTSGDSSVQLSINTIGKFCIGVDDSDGDAFVISQGSSLGTNNRLKISANGEITRPNQPAFSCYIPSTINNITGDGSDYTLTWSEFFDLNDDMSATTFIAPVSGRYIFCLMPRYGDLVAGNYGYQDIVTSNRTYRCNKCKMYVSQNLYHHKEPVVFADMDAADTATFHIMVAGGSKIVDTSYYAGGNVSPFAQGYLAC